MSSFVVAACPLAALVLNAITAAASHKFRIGLIGHPHFRRKPTCKTYPTCLQFGLDVAAGLDAHRQQGYVVALWLAVGKG